MFPFKMDIELYHNINNHQESSSDHNRKCKIDITVFFLRFIRQHTMMIHDKLPPLSLQEINFTAKSHPNTLPLARRPIWKITPYMPTPGFKDMLGELFTSKLSCYPFQRRQRPPSSFLMMSCPSQILLDSKLSHKLLQ